MPHLLHIEGSPRKQRSASIEVARAFIDTWSARQQQGTVDTLDVWSTKLPEFDGAALESKYAGLEGRERNADEAKVWADIEALGQRFHRADVIVFSVPMWNFGIPYRLKHLIDAVTQKDTLFTFDERGLIGMLGGRTMVLVAARGVALGDDFPASVYDHQVSYMSMWARMVGITAFHNVTVDKTLFGPEADTASRAQAKAQAQALAQSLEKGT
ncbi:MAG: FMN-dependent NADH-azoreductase [Rhizobacter sp.]